MALELAEALDSMSEKRWAREMAVLLGSATARELETALDSMSVQKWARPWASLLGSTMDRELVKEWDSKSGKVCLVSAERWVLVSAESSAPRLG